MRSCSRGQTGIALQGKILNPITEGFLIRADIMTDCASCAHLAETAGITKTRYPGNTGRAARLGFDNGRGVLKPALKTSAGSQEFAAHRNLSIEVLRERCPQALSGE